LATGSEISLTPVAVRAVLLTIIVLAARAHDQPPSFRWSLATPSGVAPSPRIDAPVTYDFVGRQLFMLGGLDASRDLNDLLAYSVDKSRKATVDSTQSREKWDGYLHS
jgi:hypothetical protein